jgi:hypothetical protein
MISVIIPTLWKEERLHTTLDELQKCKYVKDIVLIDNTGESKNFEFSKLNYILESENTYVNPAWNKGVKLAKCDKLLMLGDDNWFDFNSIEYIIDEIKDSIGMIGITMENYRLTKTTDIKLQLVTSRPVAYATAFFIHKNSWVEIPHDMKIWWGDNFLFAKNEYYGRLNYKLLNLKVDGSISKTLNSLPSYERGRITANDRVIFNREMNG